MASCRISFHLLRETRLDLQRGRERIWRRGNTDGTHFNFPFCDLVFAIGGRLLEVLVYSGAKRGRRALTPPGTIINAPDEFSCLFLLFLFRFAAPTLRSNFSMRMDGVTSLSITSELKVSVMKSIFGKVHDEESGQRYLRSSTVESIMA